MKEVMEVVNMVYMFEVAAERQKEYLKVTAEIIKPYWESHGCLSYSIFQGAEESAHFIKRMRFADVPAMQKSLGLIETDKEGKAVVQRFRSFVTNVSRRVYVQKL